MIKLINKDGGIVCVAEDLVDAYISAGFVPAENAPAKAEAGAKPKKTAAKKTTK